MISNAQKSLIKRAQRAAGLTDAEYREALATVTGFPDLTSSTDSRLGDHHVDRLLGYLEAIYWRRPEADRKWSPIFKRQGYWAAKNAGRSSRERWQDDRVQADIRALETALQRAGCAPAYLAGIRRKAGGDWGYRSALRRTLEARERKVAA